MAIVAVGGDAGFYLYEAMAAARNPYESRWAHACRCNKLLFVHGVSVASRCIRVCAQHPAYIRRASCAYAHPRLDGPTWRMSSRAIKGPVGKRLMTICPEHVSGRPPGNKGPLRRRPLSLSPRLNHSILPLHVRSSAKQPYSLRAASSQVVPLRNDRFQARDRLGRSLRGIELQKQRCLRPYAPWRVRFLEGAYEYYSLEADVADGFWTGCTSSAVSFKQGESIGKAGKGEGYSISVVARSAKPLGIPEEIARRYSPVSRASSPESRHSCSVRGKGGFVVSLPFASCFGRRLGEHS
ncbi:Uncharacterized protein DBV15_07555 [Temnothorax longispinosus]|uniref:Uncharacterized protein n=1 Tax=Temnothorax longispinosus TaxID=300112 RepID=A0A4S2KXF0_9HYME|nr:Uncharacterized protein DBV15_07555 [Temnothorax longispinosus]